MSSITLFQPAHAGSLPLANRIVMAPMTRARTLQPGNIPSPMMATYYAQRASAGLIITEATQISATAQGIPGRLASTLRNILQAGNR